MTGKLLTPVLVTGSPRSGSTWAGRMLAAAPELHYVHEPFNPHSGAPELGRLKFERHFTYLGEHNQARYRANLARVVADQFDFGHALRSVRRPRQLSALLKRRAEHAARNSKGIVPLIKDPIALMSARWLVREFGMKCVVMIRHPGAFVASINRLEWNSRPFRWALAQPELMEQVFPNYRAELEAMRDSEYEVIDHASMAWKLHHHVIAQLQAEYADSPDWCFVRHEKLSQDPVAGFKGLYTQLGLSWTPEVEQLVKEHSAETNPDQASGKDKALRLNSAANLAAWRSALSPADIEIVKRRVAGVCEQFYPLDSW